MPSQEVLEIPLMMFVVFASAKLLAEIFERLGQPGIVGEIVAGALVGPGLLHWVHPTEVLTALSDLGVMFLLFGVGLETKPQDLLKLGGIATLTAIAGVVLPFSMGWGLLVWWGAPNIEAIFVGAAMVATSVGITAQVLAEKGVLQERASRVILAAAVVDDVLGVLVLAAVAAFAQSKVSLRELLMPVAIIAVFFLGTTFASRAAPRLHTFSRTASWVLVPFFLAGIGLHLDLSVFNNRSILLLAVLVLLAACASKFVGCALSSWQLGRRDAIKIGVGMIPRGEVGMVVAQLGLGIGVISQNIYGVVVFMAIATTLIAPPLLKIVYADGSKIAEVR